MIYAKWCFGGFETGDCRCKLRYCRFVLLHSRRTKVMTMLRGRLRVGNVCQCCKLMLMSDLSRAGLLHPQAYRNPSLSVTLSDFAQACHLPRPPDNSDLAVNARACQSCRLPQFNISIKFVLTRCNKARESPSCHLKAHSTTGNFCRKLGRERLHSLSRRTCAD